MACLLYHVDAFTNQPFGGNPAAVCLLDAPVDERWMQAVAAEMNLSETAFVSPRTVVERTAFDLRWFAPLKEVALCGHATLAAAHALWQSDRVQATAPARFHIRSGDVLSCVQRDGGWIEMDFPATPPAPATAPEGLIESLGVTPLAVARTQFDFLVELQSEAAVRSAHPDFARLMTMPARGAILTARADDPTCDFVSRFFCPSVGVNEDPVTGSAHCALAAYWGKILGRTEFLARQVSTRGGVIRAALRGDRVALAGQAVTILRGELLTD